MVGQVDITVIICTRNRAESLRRVLTSASDMQSHSELNWELLLVDNGSADDTALVAKSFTDQLPIRYVLEERPGLSNARNRGVIEARGKYICWTDDDVIIDKNWLASYAEAFSQYPNAVVFGGVINPVFADPVPRWLEQNKHHSVVANAMAMRDFGDVYRPLSIEGDILPYGANYAIRTSEQKHLLYDSNLGVSPTHKRLGEETEVIVAALSDGAEGTWVPEAKVNHIIPTSRQSRKYISDYYRSYGATIAYQERNDSCSGKGFRRTSEAYRVPLWRIRVFLSAGLLAVVNRLAKNDNGWLDYTREHAICAGYIKEAVRQKA